jgi:LPS export ABC transporter protein LptC
MIKPFSTSIFFVPTRLFLLGFFFCAGWCSCKNSDEDIDKVRGVAKMKMKDKASGVTLYYSDKGQVKAVVHAQEMFRNEAADPAYTEIRNGLKVEFLNDSLAVESTLTAKSAKIFDGQSNVIVRNQVVVVNKKGQRLETEEIVWNQRLDRFYTNKKVTIKTPPDQVINGTGLEANADFSWYSITKMRGNISVENSSIPE